VLAAKTPEKMPVKIKKIMILLNNMLFVVMLLI